MYKYILLLLFIGLAWGQSTTIAVLDFDGDGVSQSETRTLTNRLRDEIFNTGIYIVLERGKMDEVLKEQGFQQTGCVTSECAVEVGNMLGVQQMIGGSIGKVGNIYTVSARVIDVQTGKVLKSANYDHIGDIGQLLTKGMMEVSMKLFNSQTQIDNNYFTKFGKIEEGKFCIEIGLYTPKSPITSNGDPIQISKSIIFNERNEIGIGLRPHLVQDLHAIDYSSSYTIAPSFYYSHFFDGNYLKNGKVISFVGTYSSKTREIFASIQQQYFKKSFFLNFGLSAGLRHYEPYEWSQGYIDGVRQPPDVNYLPWKFENWFYPNFGIGLRF